jgi:hypothetical protein
MALDVYYIRISSLNCNTPVHTQKKKNLGTLFDAKRNVLFFFNPWSYFQRWTKISGQKNTKKYGKRTVSRRLVRHEELTTMRSPLPPFPGILFLLASGLFFLSNLFRSLFLLWLERNALYGRKATHINVYTHRVAAIAYTYLFPVEWGQHTPAMKNVKPGKKMCVPQQRSDNRRETDRHTTQ